MQISVQQIDPVTVQLTIENDRETVQRAFEKAVRLLGRNVRVPGFRPGQAPLKILQQMLAPDTVRKLAGEILVEESLERALQEHNITPYRPPRIEIEKLQEAEPFRYKATIPLKPVVELGDYESISVELPTVEVADEELEQVIENLRQEAMHLEHAPDAKAQAEDRLVVQIKNLQAGDTHPQRFLLVLGRSFAELDNALVGMQENETKQLELTFPESWEDTALAGKTIPVELIVEKVHRPVYPTDEQLAKTFQYERFEDLQERMRQYILERKLQNAIDEATEQILQTLRERSTAHIPEALIEEETRDEAQRFVEQLQASRISVEQFLTESNMTREQLQALLRMRALTRLENTFLLLEIANKEHLEPDATEVEHYLESFVEAHARTPQERARLRADANLRSRLTQELRIEKALQKLTANLQNRESEGATP